MGIDGSGPCGGIAPLPDEPLIDMFSMWWLMSAVGVLPPLRMALASGGWVMRWDDLFCRSIMLVAHAARSTGVLLDAWIKGSVSYLMLIACSEPIIYDLHRAPEVLVFALGPSSNISQ